MRLTSSALVGVDVPAVCEGGSEVFSEVARAVMEGRAGPAGGRDDSDKEIADGSFFEARG